MIYYNIARCIFAIFLATNWLRADLQNEIKSTTASEALDLFHERFFDAKKSAEALFNPVFSNVTPPKSNPYPTESINEKNIEAFFGKPGLNIDTTLMRWVKNFYFYFEYITKLELAAKLAAYARKNNIDVTSVLEASSWKGLTFRVIKVAGSWQKVLEALKEIDPLWADVEGSIQAVSWADVPKSDFWKSIPCSQQDLRRSSFWQEYLQHTVFSLFSQDAVLLRSITDIEKTIFRFIPNIEVAYYHPDFTQLRNSSEFSRLYLILSEDIRKRLIPECEKYGPAINKFGLIDMEKVYSLSADFKESDLYAIITLSEQFNLAVLADQILNKKIPIDPAILKKPLMQEKLLCFAMLKNLQAQTYYLFDKEHISNTMNVFRKNNAQPNPSLLMYQKEDQIYLEDLAALMETFKKNAQSLSIQGTSTGKNVVLSGKGNEKVVIQDFGSWLGDTWRAVKKSSKHALQGVQDASKMFAHEAKAIGLATAGSMINSIDPKLSQKMLNQSEQLQQQVSRDFSKEFQDAQNIVNDVQASAQDKSSSVPKTLNDFFTIVSTDKRLSSDLQGTLNVLTDSVVTFYGDVRDLTTAIGGGVVKLKDDSVTLLAGMITDSVIAFKTGDWKTFGRDAVNNLNNLAYDLVSSLLSVGTFVVQTFVDALKTLVKFAGYIVSIITDLSIDASKGIFNTLAGIFDIFGWQAGVDAMSDADQWVDTHRRLIETTVTTGLLLVAVVATDGLALPLIAMTVGPQIFQEYGSYQNDERAAEKLAEEKKFINNYRTFVANNKIIASNAQKAWSNELSAKYDAQVENMQRTLGFYQNFNNEYLGNMKEHFSYYLGAYLKTQITPDPVTGLMQADVGAIYGFKTNVLNLNPSQGFPLYSKAREAFSQEIAVYPAAIMQQEGKDSISSKSPRRFWFNQKETMVLNTPVTEVEIMLQPLYVLNQFYLGLYFGGSTINLDAIRKDGKADIASSSLAKMLVYKQEKKGVPVTLQLYEHEGLGWVRPLINGPQFELGSWYHFYMRLQNNELIAAVWKDGDARPQGQKFIVSPTDQTTVGIISAGGSIEYKIIKPEPKIEEIKAVRNPLDLVSEQEREIKSRKKFDTLKKFKLGAIDLNMYGLQQILKGQYIYKTSATELKDKQAMQIEDYVVLAQSARDLVSGKYVINNIGMSPTDLPTAIVSLVSSKAYDNNGLYLTTCYDVLNVYEKRYGQLDDQLLNMLKQKQKAYFETLIGSKNFGSIILNIDAEDVSAGRFIYKAISPEPEMQDKKQKNKPLTDDRANELYDYFVMVSTDDKGDEFIGEPYSEKIGRIRSLVTGNEYDRSSNVATEKGHRPAESLKIFQENFGTLPLALANNISQSAQMYKKLVDIEKETPPASSQGAPIQKTSNTNMAGPSQVYVGPSTTQTTTLVPAAKEQSVDQQTQDAAGGQMSWGG